jgi:group I intron endonuclease
MNIEGGHILIYSLYCPIKNEIKYVGATRERVGLKKRLTRHVCDRFSGINRKNNWIKKLFKLGKRPIIELVDVIPFSEWLFWEMHYISLFKSWGFNLYNIAPGGENPPVLSGNLNPNFGKKLSQETKNKIKKRLTGNIITDEVRQKISLGMKGKIKSEETRKRLSASKRDKNGKKISGVDTNTGEIFIFNSLAEAARQTNMKESSIRSSAKRKLTMRNGFEWKYV